MPPRDLGGPHIGFDYAPKMEEARQRKRGNESTKSSYVDVPRLIFAYRAAAHINRDAEDREDGARESVVGGGESISGVYEL